MTFPLSVALKCTKLFLHDSPSYAPKVHLLSLTNYNHWSFLVGLLTFISTIAYFLYLNLTLIPEQKIRLPAKRTPNLPPKAVHCERGILRKWNRHTLNRVARIDTFTLRAQFCRSRENQWTKIGSSLWNGMIWRFLIYRICRMGTSTLESRNHSNKP